MSNVFNSAMLQIYYIHQVISTLARLLLQMPELTGRSVRTFIFEIYFYFLSENYWVSAIGASLNLNHFWYFYALSSVINVSKYVNSYWTTTIVSRISLKYSFFSNMNLKEKIIFVLPGNLIQQISLKEFWSP